MHVCDFFYFLQKGKTVKWGLRLIYSSLAYKPQNVKSNLAFVFPQTFFLESSADIWFRVCSEEQGDAKLKPITSYQFI